MNSKLFKKLNEQIEINGIKRSVEEITESEKKEIEEKIIFGDFNKNLTDAVNFEG